MATNECTGSAGTMPHDARRGPIQIRARRGEHMAGRLRRVERRWGGGAGRSRCLCRFPQSTTVDCNAPGGAPRFRPRPGHLQHPVVTGGSWPMPRAAMASARCSCNPSCDACHNNGGRGQAPQVSGRLSNSFVMQLGGALTDYGHVLNTQAIPGTCARRTRHRHVAAAQRQLSGWPHAGHCRSPAIHCAIFPPAPCPRTRYSSRASAPRSMARDCSMPCRSPPLMRSAWHSRSTARHRRRTLRLAG